MKKLPRIFYTWLDDVATGLVEFNSEDDNYIIGEQLVNDYICSIIEQLEQQQELIAAIKEQISRNEALVAQLLPQSEDNS